MARKGRPLSCLAALLVFMASVLPAWPDRGTDLFEKQCASCHSIGGGDGGGPDLKDVAARRQAAWLLRVIVEPEKLSAEKDPIQKELVEKYGYEMPALGVGPDEAKAILAYLSGAAVAEVPAGSATLPEVPMTPGSLAAATALFTGSAPLAKGGAPCLSCHRFASMGLAGGNLSAADLGQSYNRMGEKAMRAALGSLGFPTMKGIFADKPLTAEEVSAMLAVFKIAASQESRPAPLPFALVGGGIFALLLLALAIYKRRIS